MARTQLTVLNTNVQKRLIKTIQTIILMLCSVFRWVPAMQLPPRDRAVAKLVLYFLIIVHSFGLSGFVQVILKTMDLSKPFSNRSVFHHNIRIKVTVKFSFPPSDILPDFSDLFLD